MLGVEQAGFRKGQSTIDHIFTLHCLIDVYLRKKKKLYCAFVDYRKAFDSVQHTLLWDKLLKMNVHDAVWSFWSNCVRFQIVSLVLRILSLVS